MSNHAAKDREPLKPSRPSSGDKLADRKARFAVLNEFVTKRHGFLTSVPGAFDVVMEALPDSGLPDELRKLGYDLREDGETQRILPVAIVEHVKISEGSSATRQVAHAGIVKVRRYTFSME